MTHVYMIRDSIVGDIFFSLTMDSDHFEILFLFGGGVQ